VRRGGLEVEEEKTISRRGEGSLLSRVWIAFLILSAVPLMCGLLRDFFELKKQRFG
jgi:hypothetical protein